VVTSCRLLWVHPKINTTPIAWPATTSVSIKTRFYSKRNLTRRTLPTQLRLQITTPHRSFLTKTIRELYLPNHTKISTHDGHKRPPQIKPPWEHQNLHCHSCIRLAVTSMTNTANYGREYPYCKPWHMWHAWWNAYKDRTCKPNRSQKFAGSPHQQCWLQRGAPIRSLLRSISSICTRNFTLLHARPLHSGETLGVCMTRKWKGKGRPSLSKS